MTNHIDTAVRRAVDHRVPVAKVGVLVLGIVLLAACGGDDEEAAAAPGGNQAPTISGSPSTTVMQNQSYTFTPTASDANGDTLTFSITGTPGWATFNSATGRLSGTPTAGDVGTYSNIQISVSDSQASANLAAFSINVVATASGSATLSWNAPTTNTDGSPLSDLAGYKVYWGTAQGSYSNSQTVNVGIQTYVVDSLTPATWYFVVTARDSDGNESGYSNVAQKTVM
ncbi:MAG TPA: putative Ig domain-containing protein [Gammaproteobacteria bacterium]|nr:putative Ig domain-containing protein [Gammaproteobacteria bacterium]